MSDSNSLHVLLSAYQCGPGMGSVSQIGWEWYSRLAKRGPVTLVTHVRNREALEQAGAPLEGTEVHYVDTEWLAGPLYRTASFLFRKSQHAVFLVSSLDFFIHDRQALRWARKRQREGVKWDIVHAVTPLTTSAPTLLSKLGVPLLHGPLNSGLRTPKGFGDILRGESTWLYWTRNIGRWIDAVIGSSRRAARILAATNATIDSIAPRHRSKCRRMLENGVDLDLFQALPWPEAPDANRALEILFVGRLIPCKGLSMLFAAIERVRRDHPVRLTVVGDGPMRGAWEEDAERLGVSDCVRFLGSLPLDGVAREMRKAHVFCLPSVRESGGAVLLEAMAVARPIVAVEYGGPAEIIREDVGRALPATGSAEVTDAIETALREIFAEPDRWRQKGLAGRARAEREFSWSAKVEQTVSQYLEILGRASVEETARPAEESVPYETHPQETIEREQRTGVPA